ncbi:hypothetical protein F442_00487 [Phytophthora nicotianae P10297]|uniref:Uncharacterized protein n=3 Tax=Phytophthora nicotianae TaxID=4792 RepID=W2RES5_PHYN3|nr:hypothetical protein PPTG_00410 [Phytophthora nicotianae INRA-310]ETN23938.1 hypothetical protein PPTG_00410 [Phytophthora nicotianae INRA-310]ETO85913.1 hypothetical protein F444_00494 [Phytophthora nicotianae P1976]ETP54890.1 hypothetical protein F442_00487 [Phytophthora nicotianae P10297]
MFISLGEKFVSRSTASAPPARYSGRASSRSSSISSIDWRWALDDRELEAARERVGSARTERERAAATLLDEADDPRDVERPCDLGKVDDWRDDVASVGVQDVAGDWRDGIVPMLVKGVDY